MIITLGDSWKNQTSTSTIQLIDTTMSLTPLMIELLT